MIPWMRLATAAIPGEREPMHLYRRGEEYSIRVGNQELMNSRVSGSEEALADEACRRIAGRVRPRILVGGLGMGYTLAAVLRRCGPRARVEVAELVPEVVAWNRGPLAPLAGRPLEDPRVAVREADVAAVLGAARADFDAILLDVDNGPAGLTAATNDRLYSAAGLEAARTALRGRGVLAVWSAGPDAAFAGRLRAAGFDVDEVPVRGRSGGRGPRFVLWLATLRPSPRNV